MVAPTTPSADYPASLSFDPPETIDRWRPLVQWFLAIPHLVVVWALGYAADVVAVISWFVALFTGRLPRGLAGFQAMYLRYSNRTMFYAGFLRTEYPPFTFATEAQDPGNDPRLRVDFDPQLEDRNRVTVFFRLLLVIPHFVVLFLLGIAVGVVWLISFFAVIITGRWPEGIRNFVVGYQQWALRVNAYFFLLTDEYPPFQLGGGAAGTVGAPTAPPPPDPGLTGTAPA